MFEEFVFVVYYRFCILECNDALYIKNDNSQVLCKLFRKLNAMRFTLT